MIWKSLCLIQFILLLSPITLAEEKAEKPQSSEKDQLAEANALADEKLKAELATQRAETARLKAEREAITERLALASARQAEADQKSAAELKRQSSELKLKAELNKAKAEIAAQNERLLTIQRASELAALKHSLAIEAAEDENASFAGNDPAYLEKPFVDGTLTISDRRIALNGAITYKTADYITERLSFFNAKDAKLPIFIVIDYSPGGSVMSGYRILKAMEASSAPVHVVVKSFAASMAAAITTLAGESYAYPNALILHHQLSASIFFRNLNLTEQKELFESSNKWWKRLAQPIADKMGVSLEKFIEMMYENDSNGDWVEFAEKAKELKWVNHTVDRIVETSIDRHPDSIKPVKPKKAHAETLTESLDSNGSPVMYLPRLKPFDRYFLYNPDQYYRLR